MRYCFFSLLVLIGVGFLLPAEAIGVCQKKDNQKSKPLKIPKPSEKEDWLGKTPAKKPLQVDGDDEDQSDLAGEPLTIDDLTVTQIKVDGPNLVPFLVWSDDGEFLFTLNKKGLLRKISVPGFVEVKRIDLKATCSFLGRCSEGLVVVKNLKQNVLVIDDGELKVNHEMTIPNVGHVACTAKSNVAFTQMGKGLAMIDMRKGKIRKEFDSESLAGDPRRVKRTPSYVPSTGYRNLTMTSEGDYLISEGGSGMLQRIKIKGTQLTVEEFSPPLGQHAKRVCVSADGKYVGMPTSGGNRSGENHPKMVYGTYIYRVGNFQVPLVAIETGAYPEVIGFDVAAEKIYAQNYDHQLIVINTEGIHEAKYKLSGQRDREGVKAFLPHPAGSRLMVLLDSELLWVDRSKAKSNRETRE